MKSKWFMWNSIASMSFMLMTCGTETSGDDDAEADSTGEGEEEEESDDDLGDSNVYLGGEVIDQGDSFVIEGESNLLPGSRVMGEVWVDEEDEDDPFSDSTELVQDDGSFQLEMGHHEYGDAEILIKFDFDSNQDDEILRHYGEEGQELEGPYIYKHDEDYQKAEASVEYSADENPDTLTFQEPDWYDLPEDYGDPRVWIEVDEITEDGEYYYLHGKSNILEGAQIDGSYGSNSDSTMILPDGSFDLEIPYEYREDEAFEIEFSTGGVGTWNEIEEAYGSDGQNLVWDLVETRNIGDQQYIRKEIEWDG